MIVFHGSTEIIKSPDIAHSKRYLDFGKGFYLTSFQEQAEKWARRKALRKNQTAIVNVYELTDILHEYQVLRFDNEDEKWLDFVAACRAGKAVNKDYKMNDQICMVNQETMQKVLVFKEFYEVKKSGR